MRVINMTTAQASQTSHDWYTEGRKKADAKSRFLALDKKVSFGHFVPKGDPYLSPGSGWVIDLILSHAAVAHLDPEQITLTRRIRSLLKGETPKLPQKNVCPQLYKKAADILSRCNNANHKSWSNYGGRGILCQIGADVMTVCLNLYLVPGYREGLEIDRVDNNGHYALGNLRWVSRRENTRNTRRSNDSIGVSYNRRRNSWDVAIKLDGSAKLATLPGVQNSFQVKTHGFMEAHSKALVTRDLLESERLAGTLKDRAKKARVGGQDG